MKTNILISFFRLLKVKHTNGFTSQHFNKHPYKYNLYGLSSILNDYSIENAGLKITNKNDIHIFDCPFIAHIGNDFVVVKTIVNNEIEFIQGDNQIKISLDEFNKMWTGYVLIAEPDHSSIEPEYEKHKRGDILLKTQKLLLLISMFFLLTYSVIYHKNYFNAGFILLLIINTIGTYVGYLLLKKQLNIESRYVDKLCSLFKQSECNSILESDASKLFGVLSWSEVGFGYFISNVVILSFMPSLIPNLAMVNLIALPYSFWSIWYQKFKAKHWCPLCISVLFLLWIIFIVNLVFGYFNFTTLILLQLFIACTIYVIFILGTNIFISIIAKELNINNIQYEINSIKTDENVFKCLLIKQPYYETTKKTSQILLGNIKSNNLISIFSNPHCNPCAKMHKKVKILLAQNKNLCVQYIFSSFNKDLDVSNKYLMGIYQQKNGEAIQIFDEWFEFGKNNKENFFAKHPIVINNENIDIEFNKHKQWIEEMGIRTTPTILVNGYKLPDNYNIEDLQFISNIDI